MYIFLLTKVANVIYFFLLNLIIIVIKKLFNPWDQLDPTQPMWVGLGWTYVMGCPLWWVG